MKRVGSAMSVLTVWGTLGVFAFASSCGGGDGDGSSGGSGGGGGTAAGGTGGGAGGASGGSGGSGGSAGGTGGSGGSTGGSGGNAGSGGAAGGTAGGGGAGGAAGGAGGAAGSGAGGAIAQMSFFVTSTGNGTNGGNLGGLAGADAKCKSLAQAAGSPKQQWFAYLSVADGGNGQPVHARDRIGNGPWYTSTGVMLAANLAALHPTINPANDRPGYIAVRPGGNAAYRDEKGVVVPQNMHDILTGTNLDGTLATGATCNDWTSNTSTTPARVGHSDIPGPTMYSPSWNSAHANGGCNMAGVAQGGGEGRIYCFARD